MQKNMRNQLLFNERPPSPPPPPHRCLNRVFRNFRARPKKKRETCCTACVPEAVQNPARKVNFRAYGEEPRAKHFSLLPKTLTAAELSMDGKCGFKSTTATALGIFVPSRPGDIKLKKHTPSFSQESRALYV